MRKLFCALALLPGLVWGATNVYPIADNTAMTSGSNWGTTGAARYTEIDDNPSSYDDDTTSITHQFTGAFTGNPAVKLGAITDPGTDTGWIVQYRAKSSGLGGGDNLVLQFYQGDPDGGGSMLESKSQTCTNSYATNQWTLLDATVAAISNFSDVYIRLTTSGSGGTRICTLTGVVLMVPDANRIKPHLVPMTGAGLTARLFGFR